MAQWYEAGKAGKGFSGPEAFSDARTNGNSWNEVHGDRAKRFMDVVATLR